MGGKRKRTHKQCNVTEGPNKKTKVSTDSAAAIQHPLLSAYYPTVLTLRGYVLSSLPPTSKVRRRRISGLGNNHIQTAHLPRIGPRPLQTPLPTENAERRAEHGIESLLASLLDTTLVGVLRRREGEVDQSRLRDFITFSQQISPIATSSSLGDGLSSQSDVSRIVVVYSSSTSSICNQFMLFNNV